MSTQYGKIVEYKCFNDCRQEGCPGHKLRVVHHNTSDVMRVEVDGVPWYWFDYNCFKAIRQSYDETAEETRRGARRVEHQSE